MASFFGQKHRRDMYKVHNAPDCSIRRRQADRRAQLLREQRKQREDVIDSRRGLVHHIEKYSLPNYSSNRLPYRVDIFYRDKLQLSEWMRDRPEDLENWILVPCPKGKRHLVVASASKTIAYSKSGKIIDIFQSTLQSGRYLTVLDCIFNESTQEFYVLDCLVYHNQEFMLCETTFRFYWIKAKFEEFDYSVTRQDNNQYGFHYIERADFDKPEDVEMLFNRYPLWEENKPELDGFLLYHKEASYTHGKSPLVGWMCPFMVPELLSYMVHPKYMELRPEGYTNAADFMNNFDEQRRQVRRKRHFFNNKSKRSQNGQSGDSKDSGCVQKMDEDIEDGPDVDVEIEEHGDQQVCVELDELDLVTSAHDDNNGGRASDTDQNYRISIFKF